MVFIRNFNHCIAADCIHLVSSIGIHFDLHKVFIYGITVRGCHFLNTVISNFKILRKNQVALAVCEIGFMDGRNRISRYLFHILFMIHVINLKFCTGNQYGLLRFIVFFDNLQLCCKFLIQKHPPYLRLVRMVFMDRHRKILNRCIIMRCGSLPHNISSVWKRNAAGITLFIRKHFCCPICTDHNRFCRIKVITSIRFLFQAAF